ncbi:MAG: UbiA family prenyltransferase [Vicingaceae bacterium]|nr:UbiA family prenyltransferase [Vicingaceae bacterium]
MPFIHLIVFSNFFVSLCVAALTYRTFLYFNLTPSNAMLVLVFSATYFIYNFQRLVRMNQKEIDEANIGFRMKWVYKNKQPIIFTIVIVAIILVVSLFYLNIKTILALAIMGFFSVVYVVRFIPYNNKWLALRDIPFLKIFVIAFVWTLVTGFLPLISKDVNQINLLHLLFLSKQFLFVVAITIPFDIRDMKYDVEKDIKTFPLVVGVKNTLVLGMLLLLGFVAISSYEFLVFRTITMGLWIAEIIAILLVMVLLLLSKKQPELFYSFIIEGTSLLLAITVIANVVKQSL